MIQEEGDELQSGIHQSIEHEQQEKQSQIFYHTCPDGTKIQDGLQNKDTQSLLQDYKGEELIATAMQQKNGFFIEKFGCEEQCFQQGNYKDGRKVGYWEIFFDGQWIGGGDYNNEGIKIGQWKEVSEKYKRDNRFISYGQYINGQKIGYWCTIQNDDRMGIGLYNDNYEKEGEWIELDENNQCLTHIGSYNKGKRVCEWQTWQTWQTWQNWKSYQIKKLIFIGNYDIYGLKQGKWYENIKPNFDSPRWSGTYQNGLRIGKWICEGNDGYIGGGKYDVQGVKQGIWTDVDDNFEDDYFVTYHGLYKNGQRVGKWKTTYLDFHDLKGGCYDKNGIKYGKWQEIMHYEKSLSIYIFSGQYKKGIRVGKWNFFKHNDKVKKQSIGGGNYNKNGLKEGKWTELQLFFDDDKFWQHSGQYKNGQKIGQWIISEDNEPIGMEEYDDEGIKHGKWIIPEQIDLIDYIKTRSGQYENGKQVGKWVTQEDDTVIGEGLFDNNGIKQDFWIDADEMDDFQNNIISVGNYNNGQRIGKWEILRNNVKIICQGEYDENGLKQKFWKDQLNFDPYSISLQGMYKNGHRTGYWQQFTKDKKLMGGGNFDENSIKQGKWIEFLGEKTTISGEYKNNVRVGYWIIQYQGKQIGGGRYDQYNRRVGYWIRPVSYYEQKQANGQQIIKGKQLVEGTKMTMEQYKAIGLRFMRILQYQTLPSYLVFTITDSIHKMVDYPKSIVDNDLFSSLKQGSWIEIDRKYNQYDTF